jgi:hypothetical protein
MHQLALRMGRTVGELSAVLTTDEQARWMALHRRAPLDDSRLDYLFARLCLLVAQVAGAKKKSGGAFTLEEFLMFQHKPKPANPLAFMRGRFGVKVIKGKRKHGAR